MEEHKFPKFCNAQLSKDYRGKDIEFWLFPTDLTAALAYWIVKQNNNEDVKVIDKAVGAYHKFLIDDWREINIMFPHKFMYEQIAELTSEKIFMAIPEIRVLNDGKPDFIDLGALSRNVFYMIIREQVIDQ